MAAAAIAEDFLCACCHDIFVEPTTLMCGHTFCRLCLARSLLVNKQQKCPLCSTQWTGNPYTNVIMRDQARQRYPLHATLRHMQIANDEEAVRDLADFANVLREQEEARKRMPNLPGILGDNNIVNIFNTSFWAGICTFVFLCVGAWYFLTPPDGSILLKPVSDWLPKDVAQWLNDVGPWASPLVENFTEASVYGPVLDTIDDARILELTQSLMTDQQHTLLVSLNQSRQLGHKPPRDFWEYQMLHPIKTNVFTLSLMWLNNPRVTFFVFWLFDYRASVLPFVHVVLHGNPSGNALSLYCDQIPSPTLREWLVFLALFGLFPRLMVVVFICRGPMIYTNWVLAPVLSLILLLYTVHATLVVLNGLAKLLLDRSWSQLREYALQSAQLFGRQMMGITVVLVVFTTVMPTVVLNSHFLERCSTLIAEAYQIIVQYRKHNVQFLELHAVGLMVSQKLRMLRG